MDSSNSLMVALPGNAKASFSALLRKRFKNDVSLLCLTAYLITTAVFLSMWHSRVTHRFSLRAFAVFVVLCGLSLIYGRLFMKLIPFSLKTNGAFSIQFLCGYLVLNTLLFLLSFFTPFGIATNIFILAGCGLLILLCCPRAAKDIRKPVDYLPDFLCLC